MNTYITESTFARLVERACSVDRELRLELEREKAWDVYGETLVTAYDRYQRQGVSIRETFGLSYSSRLAASGTLQA